VSFDLDRLFHPRSVAVVGATERGGTYGSETLLNLARIGYSGEVWGVNPRRETVHGAPCFPSLADLPAAPDAVVVAIPAAGVPDVIDQAGAAGAGGAVVYAAGFRESAGGAELEAQLVAAAARHGLPVCGPNCDGFVAPNQQVALWGDALAAPQAGHVGLVSQSGNLAVNALATRRGLRLHTAISSGNEAVLGAADYLEHLAGEAELRSIALLLEDDGDGAHLCEALARCANANIGIAVLKIGSSAVGATAAAAHTGAVAGDQRVFRALMAEAGAAWADDLHDLLELAKALAVRTPRPRGGGLAVLTCSGGDSGLGADEAQRLGIELPALGEATLAGLRERLPAAATVANPLDYTAMIWGESETLRDIVWLVGEDPAIDHVLVFYDHPPGLRGHPAESWEAVQEGILVGAHASPVPVLVASTLPELLDDSAAWRFAEAGVPAVAGLRTGLACAVALQRAPADPERLREIAAACPAAASAEGGRWLAEHEAKSLLRDAGLPVVPGRVVAGVDDAAAALYELGAPVALKLSSPGLRHKTEARALELALDSEAAVRAAWRRLAESNGAGEVLVEQMVPPGAELLVAARGDAVVPALVVGLGGVWTELFNDVAIIPLPATPARVERSLRSLRGAGLLTGARGRPALDIAAAAAVAAGVGALLLEKELALIECNPVIVHRDGAVIVDAGARERAA
jgi:acetyl-CoA synthetase